MSKEMKNRVFDEYEKAALEEIDRSQQITRLREKLASLEKGQREHDIYIKNIEHALRNLARGWSVCVGTDFPEGHFDE